LQGPFQCRSHILIIPLSMFSHNIRLRYLPLFLFDICPTPRFFVCLVRRLSWWRSYSQPPFYALSALDSFSFPPMNLDLTPMGCGDALSVRSRFYQEDATSPGHFVPRTSPDFTCRQHLSFPEQFLLCQFTFRTLRETSASFAAAPLLLEFCQPFSLPRSPF